MTNPLDSMSYTNKDFSSVYNELLSLVSKLTTKWDPSSSNESDPGVVLIKENAIVADKNNYNIDKSILETFPDTVSQYQNARALFKQLGYTMKWYRAATGELTFSYTGDSISDSGVHYSIKIPRFTTFCDDDTTVIYTLINDVTLSDSGASVNGDVIEGTPVHFTVNNDNCITVANLDSNNRLYINDYNIAENGIFISNLVSDTSGTLLSSNNYSQWTYVDNLFTEDMSVNDRYYSFGIDINTGTCYIEFPENIQTIIGEGLDIYYIRTDGQTGNVAQYAVENIYEGSITASIEGLDTTLTLDETNLQLYNNLAITNGYDPETIGDGYYNYKNTIGTFNTLVSLRDYINYIKESDLVSNNFVTSRTTDIQSTYKIVSDDNGINQRKNKVLTDYYPAGNTYVLKNGEFVLDEDLRYFNKPEMDAYTIKLYLLQNIYNPTTKTAYDCSFKLYTDPEPDSVMTAYLEDAKSIPHDFAAILPERIAMLRNKYNINCKIIPNYTLTSLQSQAVKDNIKTALMQNFYSRKVTFGEEVTYDEVYQVILAADERIRSIILDELTFETFADYYVLDSIGNPVWKEICVSDNYSYVPFRSAIVKDSGTGTFSTIYSDVTKYRKITPSSTEKYINVIPTLTTSVDKTAAEKYIPESVTWLDGVGNIFAQSDLGKYAKTYVFIWNPQGETWELDGIPIDLTTIGIYDPIDYDAPPAVRINNLVVKVELNNSVYSYNSSKKQYEIYSDKRNEFRTEIMSKSILNGNSSLFDFDDEFTYGLTQNIVDGDLGLISNVSYVTTELSKDKPKPVDVTDDTLSIKDNEIIQLYHPLLKEIANYSNYVKYAFLGTETISATNDYMLEDTDTLVLFYKESTDDVYYKYNKYRNLSKASYVINSTVDIVPTTTSIVIPDDTAGYITDTTSNQILNTNYPYTLASGQTIAIKAVQESVLEDSNNYCYFILNQYTTYDDDSTESKYVLFPANDCSTEATQEYMLKSGEYFIVTTAAFDRFDIYGAGTRIARTAKESIGEMSCRVIDSGELMSIGVDYLEKEDLYHFTDDMCSVSIQEMDILNVSSGGTLNFYRNDGGSEDNLLSNKHILLTSDGGYKVTTQTITNLNLVNSDFNRQTDFTDSSMINSDLFNQLFGSLESLTTGASGVNLAFYFGLSNLDSTGTKLWGLLKYANGNTISDIPAQYTLTGVNNKLGVLLNSTGWAKGYTKCKTRPVQIFTFTYTNTKEKITSDEIQTIRYKNSTDSNYQELTSLLGGFDDSTGWGIRTLLNLNMDNTNAQMLYTGHKLTFNISKDESTSPVKIIYGNDSLGTKIYCSATINAEGGENISVKSYGEDLLETTPVNFYTVGNATYSGKFSSTDVLVQNGDSLVIHVPSEGFDRSVTSEQGLITYCVPQGQYILRVENDCKSLNSLNFYNENNTLLNTMGNILRYGEDTTVTADLHSAGIYYLSISSDPDEDGGEIAASKIIIEAEVDTTKWSDTDVIYLSTLNKYDAANSIENYSDVVSKITSLDANDEFNYIYKPKSYSKIDNPLDAASFMNVYHLYNPYTICQINSVQTKI